MKKSIVLAVLGIAAGVTASHGQAGQILFSNYYSSTQTTGVTYNWWENSAVLGLGAGPEISAILLWGSSSATSIWQLAPVAGSATPFGLGVATGPGPIGGGTCAGWFDGGAVTINGGVPGTYAFAIEFTGMYQGMSLTDFSPIYSGSTQATPVSPVPNLPDGLRKGTFNIGPLDEPPYPGPEPGTLALGGLGMAALLVIRRKQA